MRAIDQAQEEGVVSVNLTGGEPLLRKDIGQIAQHARRAGLFTILLTNGLKMGSCAAEIVDSGVQMVIVSIDSLNPANNRLTRYSNVGSILKGIDKLQSYGKDAPIIATTAVITKDNLEDLCGMAEYFTARNIGVEYTPYHHYDRHIPDGLSPTDKTRYRAVIEALRAMKRRGFGILNSDAYLAGIPDFVFARQKLPADYACRCGETTLFIDAALNVRACWSHGLPVLGNLRTRHLSTILRGKKAQAVRERVHALRCDRCWLLCTAEISLQWR